MPFTIANLAQTANLSAFDANFGAISSYLANVENARSTPSGIANNGFTSYIDANSILNLANTTTNVSIISAANTLQINTGSRFFSFGTDGALNLPISTYDPFHNSAQINVTSGGAQALSITANGQTWQFDASYSTYTTPTLLLPPYGAVLGDVDEQIALEMFTPESMTYVAMNYGYDQYVWANNQGVFIGTNWANTPGVTGNGSFNWEFDRGGNFTLPDNNGFANAALLMANGNVNTVYIQANTASGRWGFTNANTLVFPDSTVQITAFSNSVYNEINTAYVVASTAQTTAQNAYATANTAGNTAEVYANGTIVLANSTVNFNNTASINVSATANGTKQSNVAFTLNVSSITFANLTTANVTTLNVTSNAYVTGNSVLSGPILFSSGTVAANGSNQAQATPLTADNNYVGSGTGGVVLPTAVVGREISITNNTASPINLYPASGNALENLSNNVAVSVPAYATVAVVAKSSSNWWFQTPVFNAGSGITTTQGANGTITFSATGVTAKSAFAVNGPSVSIDNLKFNIDNSGNPTVGALSGTVPSNYSYIEIYNNGSSWVTQVGGGTSTWTTVASYGFGATALSATYPGQKVEGTFTDNTLGHIYRVTWFASATGTGYGTITVEKLI